MLLSLLDQARENGELLPHVNTSESADLIMGAFTGIQVVSQTLSDYADLEERYISMQRHVLPSLAVPSVLAALDLSPGRTEGLTAELAAAQD
ncbi:hypothetical protein ACWD00_36610 [Streptomyces viridiviolaceus]